MSSRRLATAADGAARPHAAPGGLAWAVILAVALCDQATKMAMLSWLGPLERGASVEILPGLFHFTLKANPGVAFSLFAAHPEILTYVTTAAVLIIGWWAWSIPRWDRVSRTAFGMILGGALGNLIDRYARGHVIDFFDFIFPSILGRWHTRLFGTPHFATFNMADTAICLGMALLILMLFIGREEEASGEQPPAADRALP